MKKGILGFFAGAMVMVGATAFASSTAKMIPAHYNVSEITVDGVKTGKGSTAFISNGTTYVPLRTISDALGASASWDQNTRTVIINSNKTTTTTSSTGSMPTDLPSASNNTTSQTTTQQTTTQQATTQPVVTQPVVTQPVVTQPTVTQPTYITAEKAKQIAINRAGGGQVIKFESDLYDRYPDYEIDVLNGNYIHEIEINAITGAIKKYEVESRWH